MIYYRKTFFGIGPKLMAVQWVGLFYMYEAGENSLSLLSQLSKALEEKNLVLICLMGHNYEII